MNPIEKNIKNKDIALASIILFLLSPTPNAPKITEVLILRTMRTKEGSEDLHSFSSCMALSLSLCISIIFKWENCVSFQAEHLSLTLLTSWTGQSLIWGCATCWRMLSCIPHLCTQDASSNIPIPSCEDNQKYLQTLPHMPWGAQSPTAENHCSMIRKNTTL